MKQCKKGCLLAFGAGESANLTADQKLYEKMTASVGTWELCDQMKTRRISKQKTSQQETLEAKENSSGRKTG